MTNNDQRTLNGIDPAALQGLIDSVESDPRKGSTSWGVTTRWQGGTVSESQASEYSIGGKRIAKDFQIRIDEPIELGGTNTEANPQETLLSAMNACMMVGYVAVATLMGIELESLEIETSGDIDLRGFLGIDEAVVPGYDSLRYVVRIKGDASPEDFRKLHETVSATSPNRFNLASAIPLDSELVIESSQSRSRRTAA